MKMPYSTVLGYENKNKQKNLGRLDEQGSNHGQCFYQMECQKCWHKYKANGSDIHLRKCPVCDGGRP